MLSKIYILSSFEHINQVTSTKKTLNGHISDEMSQNGKKNFKSVIKKSVFFQNKVHFVILGIENF